MLSLFNQTGPVPALDKIEPLRMAALMSHFVDMRVFEERYGRDILQKAIADGVFSYVITEQGDINAKMCNPSAIYQQIFPDYMREMFIKAFAPKFDINRFTNLN